MTKETLSKQPLKDRMVAIAWDKSNTNPRLWARLKPEEKLQATIIHYFDIMHPDVIYDINPHAGMKMTVQAGAKAKFLGLKASRPDIIIHCRRNIHVIWKKVKPDHPPIGNFKGYKNHYNLRMFSGLALELKALNPKGKKKKTRQRAKALRVKVGYSDPVNGSQYECQWKSEHLENQFKYLMKLRKEGFKVSFAIGAEKAINIIEKYLG